MKADGRSCQARRIRGSRFCFFHAPERAQARRTARRAGGLKNRITVLPHTTRDLPLVSTRDVEKLLAETINQVRRGEVDPKVANTVGYLAGILLKSRQDTEIDGRVTALEAKFNASSAPTKEHIAMPKAQLRSRLKRLERSLEGECQGCNELVLQRLEVERALSPGPDENGTSIPVELDWSSTRLARCKVCGNAQPKISIRCMDQLLLAAEEDMAARSLATGGSNCGTPNQGHAV